MLPALRAALDGHGPALLPVTAADRQRLVSAVGLVAPVPGHTALVVGTSGSTGAPKGVMLSARALVASAVATNDRLGGPGRWLMAMSARYIGGLQVLIRSLVVGTTPAVVDLTGGFRPMEFAKAARSVLSDDGPRYTALVPTQLSRLLSDGGAGLDALRGFDAVVLGGAAAPETVLASAAAAGVRIVVSYGMSETAGGCVHDGVPLDGVRIRLSGAQPTGRIELSGPVLTHGYLPDTGRPPVVDGWFATSDLGRWLPDGRLAVVGRIDDLINTGGVKVSPLLVEQALTALAEVSSAAVVGIEDPEWGHRVAAAVVPADPAGPPDESALRAAVRDSVGDAAVPKEFRLVTELPLLGPGKVDRGAVRAIFARSDQVHRRHCE